MAGKWLTCKVGDINRAVRCSKWQCKVTVKLYLGEIIHLSTSLALFFGGGVAGGERGGRQKGYNCNARPLFSLSFSLIRKEGLYVVMELLDGGMNEVDR